MTEVWFWRAIAAVCFAAGTPMCFWEPSRFGGLFLLALSACCLAEGGLVGAGASRRAANRAARVGRVLFALFLFSFIGVQAIIQQGMHSDPQAERADAVLVLGAQVKENGAPSSALAARLDRARTFLLRHPKTVAVLCGGRGPNEPCAEAAAMRAYLTARGVPESRLLLDSTSRNTIANIRNAKALLDARLGTYHTAVLSSDFHLARARRLMRREGLDSWAVAAPTPHFLIRMAMRVREYGSITGLILTGRW